MPAQIRSNKDTLSQAMKPHYGMMSILADPDTDHIRHETYEGDDHLVVPVIMLQEQVITAANAQQPELALEAEFGRFPEAWNGRPVVLDHPKRNGTPVSANAPDILQERAFGHVFGAHTEDGKLKGELWINTRKANDLGESFTRTVERLEAGEETVEVSTGLFMTAEQQSGEFRGSSYEAVWRSVVPDHLAVLPEGMVGACSVENGCGAPRVNTSGCTGPGQIQAVVLNDRGGNMACGCGSKENCQCGSQPATSQNGEGGEQRQGLFQTMMQKFGNILTLKSMRSNQTAGLSDMDVRRALEAALTENSDDFFWIVAVFDGSFVYERGFSDELYERGFEIMEDGTITMNEDQVKVRPVTQFVPVTTDNSSDLGDQRISNERTEGPMDIETIIKSGANGFTESDREKLQGMGEDVLAKIPATEDSGANTEGSGGNAAGSDGAGSGDAGAAGTTDQGGSGESQSGSTEGAGQEIPAAASSKPATVEDYIQNAPPEIQEVLNQGLRMQNDRRNTLIRGITANSRNPYSEDELKKMGLSELERVAKLAVEPSYEGAGAVRNQSSGDPNAAPEAPLTFPGKSAQS